MHPASVPQTDRVQGKTLEFEIRLLGPFDVRIGGVSVGPFRSKKSRWLLAQLVLRANRELERSWLARTLWPDSDDRRALAALRTTLKDVRAVLGTEARRLTSPSGSTVLFDLKDVTVDVHEFDLAVAKGKFEEAAKLFRGQLLEGCEEEWIIEERSQRELEALGALEMAAKSSLDECQWDQAACYARRGLVLSPLRESSFRYLVLALASAGNHSEIEREFMRFRRGLRNELGMEPDSETIRLIQRIRRKRRAEASLPVHAIRQPPAEYTLPVPLTRLIGRDVTLAQIESKLRLNRLVTLAGTGGVGKTRLAIACGDRMRHEFRWGACMVDLSGIVCPADVAQSIQLALGIRGREQLDALRTIAKALTNSDLLLILDNCEHVLIEAAQVAGTLLAASPNLRILATSREPLGITGEARIKVQPLPIGSPNEQSCPAALELLIERMEQAGTEAPLSPAEIQEAIHICRLVDGLPLAIEMAAAHAPTLPLHAIGSGLADRFRFLRNSDSTSAHRHRSFEAAIEWSYQLLNNNERDLLLGLSVFAGGASTEAIQAVCRGLGHSEDFSGLVEGLERKSFLEATPVQGDLRYRMLESVRQFALSRASQSGTLAMSQDRHSEHYALFCVDAGRGFFAPGQDAWNAKTILELDNIRAAMAWTQSEVDRGLERSDSSRIDLVTRLLSMATHCARFWHRYSFASSETDSLKNAIETCDRVLESTSSAQDDVSETLRDSQLTPLRLLGYIANQKGQFAEAESWLQRSLAGAVRLGNRFEESASRYGLAMNRYFQKDYDATRQELELALEIAEGLGDCYLQNCAMTWLGHLAYVLGDELGAEYQYRLAQSVAVKGGNEARAATSAIWLARVLARRRRCSEALELLIPALVGCVKCGFHVPVPVGLFVMSQIRAYEGHLELASQLLGAALELRSMVSRLDDANEMEAMHYNSELRRKVGGSAFDAHFRKGSELGIDDAISLAITDPK